MPTKYKILLYIFGFVFVIGIGLLIAKNLSSPAGQSGGGTGQPTPTIPDLILDPAREPQVRQFVKNFVSLYNSYSYGDYSNLTALGDYQTVAMQENTVSAVNALSSSVQPGYSIRTVADPDTFTYHYPDSSRLIAIISAQVTETTAQGAVAPYQVTATLQLQKSSDFWLVDSINITK